MTVPIYGDRKVWLEESQPFEIEWWRSIWAANKKRDQEFIGVVKSFGLNEDSFAGQTVIDVGAGPRSWPSLVLKDAHIHIIEPLADKFCLFNEGYYNLPNIASVHAVPGEELIDPFQHVKFTSQSLTNIPRLLVGEADMVWCFNCLNHCYEWRKVLDNIQAYMKVGAVCYVRIKTGETPHAGHVGVNFEELAAYLGNSRLRPKDLKRHKDKGEGFVEGSLVLV